MKIMFVIVTTVIIVIIRIQIIMNSLNREVKMVGYEIYTNYYLEGLTDVYKT